MKRFILLLCLILMLFGTGCARKTDIPKAEETAMLTQTEQDARLLGVSREEILHSWGEPVGHLSGFWGESWNLENGGAITLYYDENGFVEEIRQAEAPEKVTFEEEALGNIAKEIDFTDAPTLSETELLTEEELTQKLSGVPMKELRELWGEPDGELSGMYGEVWLAEGNTSIIVYYGGMDGVVMRVKKSPKYDWGVTLTAKDVTDRGLTIVCTQSGGEITGELQTGSPYTVQKLVNGEWQKVEYTAIDEEQVAWTMEAWGIPKDSTLEWEVDWSWLYNELPAGQYRIGKEIMDFREAGDYDKTMMYAAFEIE